MSPRLKLTGLLVVAVVASAGGWWLWSRRSASADSYTPRKTGSITFHKDVAPIIREHCVTCHRPGQSGPFNLITFEDVHKHAKQIGEVTARRYMPPWLPEKGHGEFLGERRLSASELGLLQQWIAEGSSEGTPPSTPLPPLPDNEWQLGKPDLVISLPKPYTLGPSGKDVYRNFVIPVELDHKQFVKAFEFKPNSKTIHHAFIHTDRTRQSRHHQQENGALGFDGMDTPPGADGPDGFFVSWQPGKVPSRTPEGLAWILPKNSDILLQVHMRPSGKPELVQPSVAFYFTDQPPTNTPVKICLTSMRIDIPPGERDHLIEDSYTLPVDAELLGILPHAHYLGKELRGFALLPDGTKKSLLLIRDWDFNWQGDYRYKNPVLLPKATQLKMEFTYDNSIQNIRNPNSPPQRVRYGVQSSDEMGELWFQLLPANRKDASVLAANYASRALRDQIDYNLYRLAIDPNDAKAHASLGTTYLALNRLQEGHDELQTAIRLDPKFDEAHYQLGLALRQLQKPADARVQFDLAVQLNPNHYRAHGNLGLVLMQLNDLDQAETHLRTAIQIYPEDAIAHDSLGVVLFQTGRLREAEAEIREAARLDPQDKVILDHLQAIQRSKTGSKR